MITPDEVQSLLAQGFPGAQISVEDLTGTLDHYKVVIVSEGFNSKRLIQRHQMVNEVLKEPLKGPIHALSIEAYTPDQWREKAAAAQPAPQQIEFMRHPPRK